MVGKILGKKLKALSKIYELLVFILAGIVFIIEQIYSCLFERFFHRDDYNSGDELYKR